MLADGDGLGTGVAGPGDLDGDGTADLVVGAPGGIAPAHAGRLWTLLLDSAGGVVAEMQLDSGEAGMTGPLDPVDRLGFSLAALGGCAFSRSFLSTGPR